MKWIFVILILPAIHALGQFNDSTNYFLKATSAGVLNKTNDQNSFVLTNGLRFSVYKKNVSLNTNNNWIYGEQQGVLSNNDFLSVLDADLFKTQRHIYYWALLNYEKSFSLKINHRFQGGVGIGYYVIDRKNFVVQLSDGILYESSDLFDSEGKGQGEYDTYRNSARLKFRLLVKDIIVLEGTDFLQNSLSDRKDYIIRSSTNLSVKLYKWLAITFSVVYNKLNETKRENLLLNYGLTIERYF